MKKFLIFGLIFVLAISPVISIVEAGGCRSYSYCQPTYYQESYCAPTYCAPTYAAPVIQYIDRYVAVPVPLVVTVPTISYLYNGGYSPVVPIGTTAGYNSPGQVIGNVGYNQPGQVQMQQPQVQQSQVQQTQAQQPQATSYNDLTDAQVDNLIARIEKRLAARNGNGNGGQQSPALEQPTSAAPPAVPQDTDSAVVYYLRQPLGIKGKSCADCHTGSRAEKGFQIFTDSNQLNPNLNWSKVWDRADDGSMPPEAKTNKNAAMSDNGVKMIRQKMLQATGRR